MLRFSIVVLQHDWELIEHNLPKQTPAERFGVRVRVCRYSYYPVACVVTRLWHRYGLKWCSLCKHIYFSGKVRNGTHFAHLIGKFCLLCWHNSCCSKVPILLKIMLRIICRGLTGALSIYTAYIYIIQCNAQLICVKQKLLPFSWSPFKRWEHSRCWLRVHMNSTVHWRPLTYSYTWVWSISYCYFSASNA